MNKNKCFIMGLPGAGKTTYLAALWYCLDYQSNNKLVIEKYTGDHSYLSSISKKWANVEEISRTTPEFEKQSIVLTLKDKKNNNIEISFPDLSGESFQSQYENREAKKEHAGFIKNSSGILLFINSGEITEPFFISEVAPELREKEKNQGQNEFKTRNPRKDDPTQVQIVELLQLITFIRNSDKVDLCLIISAWDLVDKVIPIDKYTPENFVKDKMPLLWQYLITNNEYFRVTYYGISAQGGKLEDSERLQEINNPYERIIIVDNEGNRYNDITMPLYTIVSSENGK
jgi:hypothetical protein